MSGFILISHETIAPTFLPPLIAKYQAAGVEIRGCEKTRALVPGIKQAMEADWTTEYLDLILSVRVVKDMDEAIDHIERYGSEHTETIVTTNYQRSRDFVDRVNSSAVMARGCEEFLKQCHVDLIVPVPLHPKRLRWRGFNQSLLLARQVSRLYGVSVDPFVLYRARETAPQTLLAEDERRKNVRGAFAVFPEKSLKKQKVLLVDDVYTSGATVNECSRALVQGGAAEVTVLTLARTI